jgi:hypothetical protein
MEEATAVQKKHGYTSEVCISALDVPQPTGKIFCGQMKLQFGFFEGTHNT